MRVAWFSDLRYAADQSLSLSSYTTKMLLPLLEKRLEIDLFSSTEGEFRGRKVRHYLSAFKEHKRNAYDIFFYQFEDSKECYFIRAHLALAPGVVWFHDYFLLSDGPEPLLNSPWQEIVNKFNDERVSWPNRGRVYAPLRPQAQRERAFAFVPLFSSERDREEFLRSSAPKADLANAQTWLLPVPVPVPAKSSSTLPDAASLEGRTIAFCGSPGIEHRAHKVLQALRDIKGAKLRWLLDDKEKDHAKDLCREFEVGDVQFVLPRSPEAWTRILEDARAAIHTLFSGYGHLNPYLPLTLAAGVPSIVTDYSGAALLPSSVTFKVEPGENEAAEVALAIRRLVSAGVYDVQAACAYARETHDARAIADQLILVLERSAAMLKEGSERWGSLAAEARRTLIEDLVEDEEVSSRPLLEGAFNDLGWMESDK